MTNVILLGPRTLAVSMRPDTSFLLAVSDLGLRPPDWENGAKAFTFKRRKYDGAWGWEIGLHCDSFWTNLSAKKVAPFPKTRAEARAWAIGFAQQHGFEAKERIRPREMKEQPRPSLTVIDGGKS